MFKLIFNSYLYKFTNACLRRFGDPIYREYSIQSTNITFIIKTFDYKLDTIALMLHIMVLNGWYQHLMILTARYHST